MIASWPGPKGDEYALARDRSRGSRLLILPALFDEANKTRKLLAEVMRRLDGAGIDSLLPDMPGCNESRVALETQDLSDWREAAAGAAAHFRATHVLAVRGGALLAPPVLPGWRYAAVSGGQALKALLRARVIAAREAGADETSESLLVHGREHGLDLAGYRLGAAMVSDLEHAPLPPGSLGEIGQADIGGGAPWLRAEPDFDPAQADALAAIVAMGLRA